MNPHIKIFNNYKENVSAFENNLTRAFIITLRKEPQLLRDFLFLINNEYTWDDIEADIQRKDVKLDGIDQIIGLAITTATISEETIINTLASGAENPIPDFVIYSSKTLIIGEVKKGIEMPIAQLKNQVDALLDSREDKDKIPEVKIKAITWTDIMSKLIIPFEQHFEKKGVTTGWAIEFREYITTHYSDWLPTPTLDKIPVTKLEESVNRRFAEKRLFDIQGKTRFGAPHYWVGGRMTLSLDFPWATEAAISLYTDKDGVFVCITMWPANTKTQGNYVFNRNLDWTRSGKLKVGSESFEMENLPCVKFSHVMGKFIADYYFQHAEDQSGKPILSRDNFYKISYRWNREEWPEFTEKMDELCNNEPNWRESSHWSDNFEDSGKNFVFISLGAETNIYIPYQTIQKLDEKDSSGQSAASLIEQTIDAFKNLIEKD